MAIIFKNKGGKSIKVDHGHNYGGFWLDKGLVNINYEGRTGASTIVKALKLRNYQKAISNFVKILSQRDVPVTFRGSDSYTDNNRVVIAADVSDKNFDITAGLALHEASHLKYTDFTVLHRLFVELGTNQHTLRIKSMINWLEDRRIDSLVFKSCPGYKAYYHKLYDHYFRTKEVSQMLKSKQYRTETYDNYEAHIINMMSVDFKSSSLQILPLITKMIDVNNILRLNNTQEVSELAIEIVQTIEKHLESLAQEQQQEEQEQDSIQVQDSGSGDSNEDNESQDNESQDNESQDVEDQDDSSDEQEQDNNDSDQQSDNTDGQDEQEGEVEEQEVEELSELRGIELREIAKQLADQKSLINGNIHKRAVNGKLEKQLKTLQNTETDYTAVGNENFATDCVIYRLDKEVNKVVTLYSLRQTALSEGKSYFNYPSEIKDTMPNGLSSHNLSKSEKACTMVSQGFQLGTILGRKIQTRRESRELETNRLRSGKIDTKRVAHAGYGIENIFNQIHVDKYNKANIHLTIDASGSMGGERWDNSLKMAMALGKAVDMIEGINLQVSMRETTPQGNSPAVSIIYDSRTNKLNHLKMLLEMYKCNSMTPEGLCLEAMLNKKLLVPTTSDCDSYLINLCDGEPGMSGGYGGQSAIIHTKNQVRRINNELGIKHVGYFFGEADNYSYTKFTQMYGISQSIAIPNASNATVIAAHMNKQLMQK